MGARLAQRFRGASRQEVEDAVGYALVDLFDYWVFHPTSIDQGDPKRTYAYAVKRAEWLGKQFLAQALHLRSATDSLDNLHEQGIDVPDPTTLPEEALDAAEERAYALHLVDTLPPEKALWLQNYLEGRSARDEGREAGVSHSAVLIRRRALLRGLREAAREDGMVST